MRHTLKGGLLTSLYLIVWLFGGFTILRLLSIPISTGSLRTLTGALGLVILFIGILQSMKAARKSSLDKSFGYWAAFKSGFFVALIVAICLSLASLIYLNFINPRFQDDMIREAKASLESSGANPEDIERKLRMVRDEFSIKSQSTAPLIVQTLAGSLFSAILAFFFRKK